jgi:hypothetical protein
MKRYLLQHYCPYLKIKVKIKKIVFFTNKNYDLVNNSGSDLSTTPSITTTTVRYYRNNYYNYRSINDNNGTNNSYNNNNNNIRNMEVLPCGICDNTRGRGTRESGIARHSQTKNPLEFDLKENEEKKY